MSELVTGPGIYDDIDETTYHQDSGLAPNLGRSLSQSGAKTLLRNPARFAWERDHGRPAKDSFDVGSLAHALILGRTDPRLRIIDCYDWRRKADQVAKADAHAAGMIPVNRAQLLEAARVAAAVRRHPLAAAILSEGRPEVTAYWIDPGTGITCRARIDWVHPKALVDVKTAAYGRGTADAFGKSAAEYDYPMQAAHYTDGWYILTGELLPFVTITVEKDPPYLVTVGQYKDADVAKGRAHMARAKELFAELESSGQWDDSQLIHTFDLPAWYR